MPAYWGGGEKSRAVDGKEDRGPVLDIGLRNGEACC